MMLGKMWFLRVKGRKVRSFFTQLAGILKLSLWAPCSSTGSTLLSQYVNHLINLQRCHRDNIASPHFTLESQTAGTKDSTPLSPGSAAMDNWDPMKEVFMSNRNAYSIDTDDPGTAISGFCESFPNSAFIIFCSNAYPLILLICPFRFLETALHNIAWNFALLAFLGLSSCLVMYLFAIRVCFWLEISLHLPFV